MCPHGGDLRLYRSGVRRLCLILAGIASIKAPLKTNPDASHRKHQQKHKNAQCLPQAVLPLLEQAWNMNGSPGFSCFWESVRHWRLFF